EEFAKCHGKNVLRTGVVVIPNGGMDQRVDRFRKLATSSAMARMSDSSRALGAARNVSERSVRMMCSGKRVLKNSIAVSDDSASEKNCSNCAVVGGGASLRGGAMIRVASAAARCSSYSAISA